MINKKRLTAVFLIWMLLCSFARAEGDVNAANVLENQAEAAVSVTEQQTADNNISEPEAVTVDESVILVEEAELPEPQNEEILVPEPKETETPKPETTEAPALQEESQSPEKTEAPNPEKTETPGPEKTETPGPEKTETPGPEKTEAPNPEKTETPGPEKTEAPIIESVELKLASFEVKNVEKGPGTGSISGSVECEAGKNVLVTLMKVGETVGVTVTCTSTSPKFTFSGLEAGDYRLTIRYEGAGSPALTLVQTVTEKPAIHGAIKIVKVVPGELEMKVVGTADPLSAITVSTEPASSTTTVVTDASGAFSTTLVCAPKKYTAVCAQYSGEASTMVKLTGTFVVTDTEEEEYPTLRRGDRYNPYIYLLQQRLKDLGYYSIRVDGIYGATTESAVRRFQKVNGLPATGIANNATQKLLYSSKAKGSGEHWPDYGGGTLYRSSRYQAAVVPLQRRLRDLGYYSGSVDGYYGSGTYRAVRNFQSRNGLTVTGNADPATQALLYSSSARHASGSGSSSDTGYRLLYWGCQGEAVSRLQRALLNAGYTQVRSVDGFYGQWTYDAVRAFQKDHGLSVDGIAGRKTQNALYGTHY